MSLLEDSTYIMKDFELYKSVTKPKVSDEIISSVSIALSDYISLSLSSLVSCISLRCALHLTSVCITFTSCELDEGQTHACFCLFSCCNFVHLENVLSCIPPPPPFFSFPYTFSHSNVLAKYQAQM